MHVSLRLWSDNDADVLHDILGDPEMTAFLGGPETPEQLRHRHQRYCQTRHSPTDRMFVILVDDQPAGSIGFWQTEWHQKLILETGWSVLPFAQQRGVASHAVHLLINELRSLYKTGAVFAFPTVENVASLKLCEKTGFVWLTNEEFEYPPGQVVLCAVWRYAF